MCIQWDCQCSSKQQSVQILFVWSWCLHWLVSDPFSHKCPSAAMSHGLYTFKSIYMHVILTLSITIIVLFHHDDYDYYWDCYRHGHSFLNHTFMLSKILVLCYITLKYEWLDEYIILLKWSVLSTYNFFPYLNITNACTHVLKQSWEASASRTIMISAFPATDNKWIGYRT